MTDMIYYAHAMPGVEQIAWLEIRDKFPGATFVEYLFAKDQNGIVLWKSGRNENVADLLKLRTTEDVFVQVVPLQKLSRDWQDLRVVEQLFQHSTMLAQAVKMKQGQARKVRYRVISRKSGDHQYRRKDFQEACIKGIEKQVGRHWELVDDNADIEIWANILGSTLLCGLRLSDRTMRHRPYRVVNLPAALRPSVAAAMVRLTEPDPTDVFLDPMCGSGTILAERMLFAPYTAVLGGDSSAGSVQASVKNLNTIQKPFTVRRWDACQLPLDANSIDKAATNLPFGKQIGSIQEVKRLYPCFFAELERVLKPNAYATVLSSEYELVKSSLRQRAKLQIITGYSIAVLGQWGRLYILKKS